MTSKISLLKLMQEDLRHRIWMAVLSILGSFLSLPVLFLFDRANYVQYATFYDAYGVKTIDMERLSRLYAGFFPDRFWAQGVILVAGAGIVAILGFHYLYSRKLSDTWHSLPVSRSRMFLASYLNGLLIWLVPFLISMAVTLAAAFVSLGDLSAFAPFAAAAGISTLAFIGAFLMVYHLCLAAVMVSGNAINALVTALITGVGAYMCYYLICELFSEFIPSFLTAAIPGDIFKGLSPLACAVGLLQSLDSYFYQSMAVNVMALAVSALNLLLAWRLYIRRPSELAEHGICIGWLKISLQYAGAILSGLFVCLIVSLVSQDRGFGWIIFGVVLGCSLAFILLDIIFQMNIRAFLKHKLQLAGITAFTLLLVLSISQDWYGYAGRLPSADSIASASIHVSSFNDDFYSFLYESGRLSDPSTDRNSAIFDYGMEYSDIDTLYPLLLVLSGHEPRAAEQDISSAQSRTATVRLDLKNGDVFYRSYPVYPSDRELLRPIMESDEYLNTFYRLSMGQVEMPLTISIRDAEYKSSVSIDEDEAGRVMAAYSRDFKAHSSLEELDGGMTVGYLNIQIDMPSSIAREANYRYYLLNIMDNYTETLTLLSQLGYRSVKTIDDLDAVSLKLNWSPEQAAGASPTHPESNSGERIYSVTVTDQAELNELLPLLHIGIESSAGMFADKGYVSCGEITTADGSIYSCYVREGELPRKWIDAMRITE